LQIEHKIARNEDRPTVEQQFHQSIVRATHNAFMEKLMPVLYPAIDKGVILSEQKELAIKDTINDHKLIMNYMKNRDPEGARSAMKIHILHAMHELGIK